jgi:hemerythrin-like domain-containing protein
MRRQSNAIEMLRQEHQHVQNLFQRFERSSGKEQEKLCREVVAALSAHTRVEEDVFYPYVREATARQDLIEEASVEHGAAKQLLAELESNADDLHRHAVVKVLSEYVGHHIREEEEKIFPLIEKAGVDLEALGEEMAEHKEGRPRSAKGTAQERKASRDQERNREASAKKGNGRTNKGQEQSLGSDHPRADDDDFVEDHGEDLSRSTQRAKWIHEPGEKDDHTGQTLATRNPQVIMGWAKARNVQPATTPGGDPENPRVLRFDFPDYDKGLQHVSWEAWMRTFEERDLVFLHQQHMKAGNESNFFRLDSPHREEG